MHAQKDMLRSAPDQLKVGTSYVNQIYIKEKIKNYGFGFTKGFRKIKVTIGSKVKI